jgi:hypothetical protein
MFGGIRIAPISNLGFYDSKLPPGFVGVTGLHPFRSRFYHKFCGRHETERLLLQGLTGIVPPEPKPKKG